MFVTGRHPGARGVRSKAIEISPSWWWLQRILLGNVEHQNLGDLRKNGSNKKIQSLAQKKFFFLRFGVATKKHQDFVFFWVDFFMIGIPWDENHHKNHFGRIFLSNFLHPHHGQSQIQAKTIQNDLWPLNLLLFS